MGAYTALHLKGLQDFISVSCTKPEKLVISEDGLEHLDYVFDEGCECKLGDGTLLANTDIINGFKNVSQLYKKANPDYDGQYDLPILWDKELKTIVNNDSLEIIRMLNGNFNAHCKND